MKTLWSRLDLRTSLSRNDLRAALLGIAGGVLLAALITPVRGVLAVAGQPASEPGTQGHMEVQDGKPVLQEWERERLEQIWTDYRRVLAAGSLVDWMAWSEAWTPMEWRSWARPEEDLSWPPPAPVSTECPPGAYCDPDIPPTICDADPRRWRSSTPPCPFEAAPIAELSWATGNLYGETLDETGQPLWLGCKAIEGKWHIVSISVGPDGRGLTEDDRTHGCFAPQYGWPPEFMGGWPVDESVARSERAVPPSLVALQQHWLRDEPGQR